MLANNPGVCNDQLGEGDDGRLEAGEWSELVGDDKQSGVRMDGS